MTELEQQHADAVERVNAAARANDLDQWLHDDRERSRLLCLILDERRREYYNERQNPIAGRFERTPDEGLL